MKVRPAVEADHEAIMRLQAAYPDRMALNPYEAVNGPVFVTEDEDGHVNGVAVCRRTVEAFMALEPGLSDLAKAKAMLKLVGLGSQVLRDIGYNEFHAFTDDPKFARVLNGLPESHEDKRFHTWVNLVTAPQCVEGK